jgi:hypothetical protein
MSNAIENFLRNKFRNEELQFDQITKLQNSIAESDNK